MERKSVAVLALRGLTMALEEHTFNLIRNWTRRNSVRLLEVGYFSTERVQYKDLWHSLSGRVKRGVSEEDVNAAYKSFLLPLVDVKQAILDCESELLDIQKTEPGKALVIQTSLWGPEAVKSHVSMGGKVLYITDYTGKLDGNDHTATFYSTGSYSVDEQRLDYLMPMLFPNL